MSSLSKFTVMLDSAELAQALVDAGFNTPTQIELASDEDVEEAVGSENLAAVRVVFPGREQE